MIPLVHYRQSQSFATVRAKLDDVFGVDTGVSNAVYRVLVCGVERKTEALHFAHSTFWLCLPTSNNK